MPIEEIPVYQNNAMFVRGKPYIKQNKNQDSKKTVDKEQCLLNHITV